MIIMMSSFSISKLCTVEWLVMFLNVVFVLLNRYRPTYDIMNVKLRGYFYIPYIISNVVMLRVNIKYRPIPKSSHKFQSIDYGDNL